MRLVLSAIALLIAGCTSDVMQSRERAEQANTAPPLNARGEVLAFMRTYLNDPTGIRGAFWSEPLLRPVQGVNRYTACVRYNARNSSGQYAGSKDSLVLFRDGRFDRLVDNGREPCKDRTYHPFPELERLTR
ncbi:MAG: hypothetical protein FJX62_00165 [Alphaproteobacteria bacterium]|nr:hypothetical protein [Alphaproteobacteria bacterium]